MIKTQQNLESVSGIYSAIHRDSGRCYVGSSVNIGSRLRNHLCDARNGSKSAIHKAIRQYGTEAFDFEVLEECAREKLLERESFYISFLNAASLDGFNTLERTHATYGVIPSPATRMRLSESKKGKIRPLSAVIAVANFHRGRKRSQETRDKISAAMKGKCGRIVSEKTRKILSLQWLGRKQTPEHRENNRKARIGFKHTAESREKMSASRKGVKRPPRSKEHSAKISAALKGKKHSAETREKIRIAGIGRKHTPESIAKMSAARSEFYKMKQYGNL